MSDETPKIKVFASDDNLKALGELLSNDSSRKIIFNLMNKEMYTNEIATKLDMRVSLVIHHLRKMEDLGMLEIGNKKIKRKGQKHRFFTINSDLFVTVNKTKEEIKTHGLLKKIFRDGIKFTSIAVASFVVHVLVTIQSTDELTFVHSDEINLTFPFLVIIIGLICILAFNKKKKKIRINRKLFH